MEPVPKEPSKGSHFAILASGDPVPEARPCLYETRLAQEVPHSFGDHLEGMSTVALFFGIVCTLVSIH